MEEDLSDLSERLRACVRRLLKHPKIMGKYMFTSRCMLLARTRRPAQSLLRVECERTKSVPFWKVSFYVSNDYALLGNV